MTIVVGAQLAHVVGNRGLPSNHTNTSTDRLLPSLPVEQCLISGRAHPPHFRRIHIVSVYQIFSYVEWWELPPAFLLRPRVVLHEFPLGASRSFVALQAPLHGVWCLIFEAGPRRPANRRIRYGEWMSIDAVFKSRICG